MIELIRFCEQFKMIKLTYISVMIACLLISSHAFTFRNSEGYRDYNKKVFDAHNDARQNPKKYADFAEAQKSFFVYDGSGNPTTGICTDSDFVAKSTEWSFTLWTSEGVSAFDEAIDYLNNFKTPLRTLIWSESLSQSCFDHIKFFRCNSINL